jgi:RNA polymerase sigma-70 factor (ECF subfamily)
MELNEQEITEPEFEEMFKTHFRALHSYAFTIIREESHAEEIVQQVFYKVWERKKDLNINQSLKSYLYQSVYNESLNYLKHLKVKKAHQSYILSTSGEEESSSSKKLMVKELEAKIVEALKLLPEQCRTIFQLSRFENLKYREIADQLGLSVKTVENQMGKALRIMRTHLAEYLPVIIAIVLSFIVHQMCK